VANNTRDVNIDIIATDKTSKAFKSTTANAEKTTKAVKDLDSTMAKATKVSAANAEKTSRVTKSLDAMTKTSKGSVKGFSDLSGASTRLNSHLSAITTAGKIAAVGLGALAVAGIKSGLATAGAMEQAKISFDTLLGSTDKATEHLKDLTAFAANTPFELPGLIQADKQLIGAGESAKKTLKTLTAWGDASGALGQTQEQFARTMLAVTQAMGKGKLQGEELMQITEAGIPIWSILAKAMGKSIPELQKLSQKGQLLTKDVLPKLEAQMEKDYGGAMAKQAMTLNGLWSTFKDTLNIGLGSAMSRLTPTLRTVLPNATKKLSTAMTGLGDSVSRSVTWLREHKTQLKAVGGFLKDVTPSIVTLTASVATMATALKLAAIAQTVYNVVLGIFVAEMETIIGPVELVVAGIAALAVGVQYAYTHWGWFKTAVNTTGKALHDFWFKYGKPAWDAFSTGVVTAWNSWIRPALIATGKGLHDLWFKYGKPAWDGLSKGVADAWNNWISPALHGIARVVSWMWNTVTKPVLKALGGFIRTEVAPVFLWFWHHVTGPALKAIWTGVQTCWALVKVYTAPMIAYWKRVVFPVLGWLWNHGIKPYLSFMWKGFQGAWKIIKPILSTLGSIIKDKVYPAFKKGVQMVGKAWDGLTNILKTPVLAVVKVVNKGIIDPFNYGIRLFHLPMDKVGHIPAPKFAKGGYTGVGGVNQPAGIVHAGEFVFPQHAVRRLGVRRLGALAGLPGYADGGAVKALQIRQWLPSVDPLPYVWGGVGPSGYDCSGLVGEVWARMTGHQSYRRNFTTSGLRSNPGAYGLEHGPGMFSIGVNSHHTAGNIAGQGFEARSRASGIIIGPRAAPVNSFPTVLHLASAGGGGGPAGAYDPLGVISWLKARITNSTNTALNDAGIGDGTVDELVRAVVSKTATMPLDAAGKALSLPSKIAGQIIGKIPGFADGGVVSRPTMAMVGESGPEAIIPLSGGGITLTTNLVLDKKIVARVSREVTTEELRKATAKPR
jgi:tape measure domain-containing protein